MGEQESSTPDELRVAVPWIYLSSFSLVVAGAVFYLFIAHAMSTSQVGAVVLLSAVATLLGVLFTLGLGSGVQHFLAYHIARQETHEVRIVLRSTALSAMALTLLASTSVFALAPYIAVYLFHSPNAVSLIRLSVIYVGLGPPMVLLQAVLLGYQRFRTFAVLSMLEYGAIYGGGAIVGLVERTAQGVVIGWDLGSVLACIAFIGATMRPSLRRPLTTISTPSSQASLERVARSLLLYSIPLFAASLLSTGATYIDRLVLAILSSLAVVGVYNFAILATAASLFVVAPFSTVLLPRLSAAFGSGDTDRIRLATSTSITLVTLAYVPLALFTVALAPIILRFFLGPDFVSATVPLSILLTSTAVFIPGPILITVASAIRRTKLVLASVGLTLMANLLICYLSIPSLGSIGAALGNSSSTWVTFAVLYVALSGSGLIRIDARAVTKIWVASSLMFAVIAVPLWLVDYNLVVLPLVLIAGLIVFLLSVRKLRVIDPDQVAVLRSLAPRRFPAVARVISWLSGGEEKAA